MGVLVPELLMIILAQQVYTMDLSHPFSIINNYIDCFVGASEDE
jgi:hypothetical protein